MLFLADRNILANQAYNAFLAFAEDALVRIKPDEISKKGRVPKNGSIFFTIFQTFMTLRQAQGERAELNSSNDTSVRGELVEPHSPQNFNFGEYPPDFFDLIIIDECHRGGANDESNWRGILEYFAPAVQLGLTATPKRKDNADTYAYFGEPVYSYSLKEGINDGFLTLLLDRARGLPDRHQVHDPGDRALRRLSRKRRRAVAGPERGGSARLPHQVPHRARGLPALHARHRDPRPALGRPGHARPRAPHRRHREAGRHREHQLRAGESRQDGAAARGQGGRGRG